MAKTLRADLQTLRKHRCTQLGDPVFTSAAKNSLSEVYAYLCQQADVQRLDLYPSAPTGRRNEHPVELCGPAVVRLPGRAEDFVAVDDLVGAADRQLAELQVELRLEPQESASSKKSLVGVQLQEPVKKWLRYAYVKYSRLNEANAPAFWYGEVWREIEASDGRSRAWERSESSAFPAQYASLPDLDLRNLGSLVKSSSSSDSLEAVRYLVWNGSLKRYLKPAELVFLDGYSRLSATVVQYYAEFSTNPVYWAASVRTSRVWRAGLDLHLPGLPPRGWELQFGGNDLQCFYSSKLKSNAAALYYLLMVKLRVHSLAAVAEWLVLYLFQMVLEWGAKRFRYLAAGVEELVGAAGRRVSDLVQWARKHLVTKAADLLPDLPPAVQRSLRPLGFGTYFLASGTGPSSGVRGAVAAPLWQERAEIFTRLNGTLHQLALVLGGAFDVVRTAQPESAQLGQLWEVVRAEFTTAPLRLSPVGGYALQEALELAAPPAPHAVLRCATTRATPYLCLQNAVDHVNAADEDDWARSALDAARRASVSYGPLLHVAVEGAGRVFLRFATTDSAAEFKRRYHEQQLEASRITVGFVTESEYANQFRATAQFVVVGPRELHQLGVKVVSHDGWAGYQRAYDNFVYSLEPTAPTSLVTSERYPPAMFSVLPPKSQEFFQQHIAPFLESKDPITLEHLTSQLALESGSGLSRYAEV